MAIDNRRLREVRDAIIRYVYDNGAGIPYFSVEEGKISAALGLTKEELSAAFYLMLTQGIIAERGLGGTIGLSDYGQAEAERLGPAIPMREPTTSQSVHINAAYSIVQVGGSGSTQTANLTVDNAALADLLRRISTDIERLNLDSPTREHAKSLVSSLQQGLAAKIGQAGLKAIGASLASILTGAGSTLGAALANLLGIGPG